MGVAILVSVIVGWGAYLMYLAHRWGNKKLEFPSLQK